MKTLKASKDSRTHDRPPFRLEHTTHEVSMQQPCEHRLVATRRVRGPLAVPKPNRIVSNAHVVADSLRRNARPTCAVALPRSTDLIVSLNEAAALARIATAHLSAFEGTASGGPDCVQGLALRV